MMIAHVGLGANLGDRAGTLRGALAALSTSTGITLQRVSAFYETEPVDRLDQPWYLNAVAAIETTLAPTALMVVLHRIEAAFDRDRRVRYGPRTLDLDLLLFGNACILSGDLQVPHPRLHARDFVLAPLAEIAPDLVHPVFGLTPAAMSARLEHRAHVRRLGDAHAVR